MLIVAAIVCFEICNAFGSWATHFPVFHVTPAKARKKYFRICTIWEYVLALATKSMLLSPSWVNALLLPKATLNSALYASCLVCTEV